MRLPFAQLVPLLRFRGAHFWFNSVRFLSKKKVNKPKLKKKFETGSNRLVSVWFGFLGKKLVYIGLAWFF